MTMQECYNKLGGNLEQIKNRLPSVGIITKFITKFLDDGTFDELCRAMQSGDRKEAFRAAHTLKGLSANLSFDRLFSSAENLTEILRPESDTIADSAFSGFEAVKNDYELTVNAIREYLASNEQLS